MIVNAPYMFSTIWAIVKGWLDEKTREKIQIKSDLKSLPKYVDADQLINFLGGNCTAKLEDDWGPWQEYEIVDGTKKDDVVGIKKINTNEVFTL